MWPQMEKIKARCKNEGWRVEGGGSREGVEGSSRKDDDASIDAGSRCWEGIASGIEIWVDTGKWCEGVWMIKRCICICIRIWRVEEERFARGREDGAVRCDAGLVGGRMPESRSGKWD